MQVRFMSTDGGVHPADKWADMTASYILDLVQINDQSATPEAQQGRREKKEARDKIEKILEGFHDGLQASERSKLEGGFDRLREPLDPTEHDLDGMTGAVCGAMSSLAMLGPHFAKPEVHEAVRDIIGQHFATSMDIERSTHADKNQFHPVARAYRAARGLHGAVLIESTIDHFLEGGHMAHLAGNGPPPKQAA